MMTMKTYRQRLLVPTLLVLLALAAAPLIGQDAAPRSSRSAATARIEGLARPSRETVIIAPLEGKIETVDVNEGDRVEADQPLLKLDDGLQQIAVQSARIQAEATAGLEDAKAILEESKIQLERTQRAFDKGAASDWEVRQSKLQVRRSELGVQQAENQLKLAAANLRLEEERLRRYTVRAPFAGRIIREQVEAGSNVTRDDELILLASLDPLEATLYLPIQLYGKVKPGTTYRLVAGEPVNGELQGTLTHIDRMLDAASQTFRCKFEIPNPDDDLPANFTVTLPWPQ